MNEHAREDDSEKMNAVLCWFMCSHRNLLKAKHSPSEHIAMFNERWRFANGIDDGELRADNVDPNDMRQVVAWASFHNR